MAVQVLFGVGDRERAVALRAQTGELAGVEVIAVEATSADVISRVGASPIPDVILVDSELGPFPALDLVRQLSLRRPQMAVVLIAEDISADTYGRAMAAGARGVLSRQPTVVELQNRINEAAEWTWAMREHLSGGTGLVDGQLGMIAAVCGAKGGTGATTLAVQMAVACVEAGRTVCLVDMDLQTGDLPSYLDVTHRRSIVDMAAAAGGLDGTILAEALFVHPAGPHVLLAPPNGEQAEDLPARASRQILGGLKSRYDVVIVDCGAYLTDGNAMAIELADKVIITATPDLPALRGAKRLVKLWGRLQLRREEDLAVLLVRHDKRNEIQPEFARKALGVAMLKTTLPAAFRGLEEAANTGSPKAVASEPYRKAVQNVAKEAGLIPLDLAGKQAAEPASADRGSQLVQFAGITPLLLLVLLIVYQALLVGLTTMYASHAANEGSRAVAVLGYTTPGAKEEVRQRAVARITGGWADRDTFRLSVSGGYVKVSIRTPSVLPWWNTPFDVNAQSRITREGGGLLG